MSKINAAIAQELGWVDIHIAPGGMYGRPGPGRSKRLLPRYDSDLNLCQEFEVNAPREYWRLLAQEIEPIDSSPMGLAIPLAKATAPQRCAAFLRTKGIEVPV